MDVIEEILLLWMQPFSQTIRIRHSSFKTFYKQPSTINISRTLSNSMKIPVLDINKLNKMQSREWEGIAGEYSGGPELLPRKIMTFVPEHHLKKPDADADPNFNLHKKNSYISNMCNVKQMNLRRIATTTCAPATTIQTTSMTHQSPTSQRVVHEDPPRRKRVQPQGPQKDRDDHRDCTYDLIPEFISGVPSDDDSISTLGSQPQHEDFSHRRGIDQGLGQCPSSSADPSSGRSIFRDYWKTDGSSHAHSQSNNVNVAAKSCKRFPTSGYEDPDRSLDDYVSRYTESVLTSRDWSSYINDELKTQNRHHRGSNASLSRNRSEYENFIKVNESGRTALPSAALLNDKDNQKNYLMIEPSNSCNNITGMRKDMGTEIYKHNTNSSAQNSIPSRMRRKIFPSRYSQDSGLGSSTHNSLPSYGYVYNCPRKNRRGWRPPVPTPLLGGKKLLRSSLRDRSTSLSEATTMEESFATSTRPSVSFERQVTVHEIDKPVEQYVHDGWSERFF